MTTYLHHELSKITDYFRAWRHLDQVAQQQIGIAISLFDFFKLLAKSERVCLELQTEKNSISLKLSLKNQSDFLVKDSLGILAARYFVDVHVAVAGLHGGRAFEWCVQCSSLFPVGRVFRDVLQLETSVQIGALQGGYDSTHTWLRRKATHGVHGYVYNVSTGFRTGKHRSDTSSGSIVRMNVDWDI